MASSIISSIRLPNLMPFFCAIIGTKLNSVNPGSVLISKTYAFPESLSIISVLVTPLQPKEAWADTDAYSHA